MRKIKFRGRIHDGWKFVYGFYYEKDGNSFICDAEHELTWLVAPESVAQLVGYDKDGKEVYEGDQLIYANELWTAQLGSYMRNSATLCHYNFKQAVLKENDNEIQNAAAQNQLRRPF